jgi:branched-chain amino acid transport system substrate-binding protein
MSQFFHEQSCRFAIIATTLSLTTMMGCESRIDSTQPQVRFASLEKIEPVEDDPIISCDFNTYNDPPQSSESLVIGLDADMSSGSAASGEAIRRGIELAIREINGAGGLLGRRLEVVIRDHRGNPDRGVDNIIEFAKFPNILAIVGGIHTPVALQELETIHTHRVLYLGPWAAGTRIVSNGFSPNYVFRVSVRDEYAGGYLVEQATSRGFHRIGLLLERTGWGRSNLEAINAALSTRNLEPARVEWVNWGEKNVDFQIQKIVESECDALLLVCNPIEGAHCIKSIANLPKDDRIPLISHWGISAGDFFDLSKSDLPKVDLTFLQTFSFVQPNQPERAGRLFKAYRQNYPECVSPRDVFSPVGTAHAYELVTMLAIAVRNCNSLDVDTVRNAMEHLTNIRGVIRDYERPFTPTDHDALDASSFILARYDDRGAIVPIHARKRGK